MSDTYLVFDIEDRFHSGAICHSAEEAKDFIAGIKDRTGLRVLRITEGELCRDLSDEFLTEPEIIPEPAFNRTAYMRRIGAFSR